MDLGVDDGKIALHGEVIFTEEKTLKSGKTLFSFDLYDGTSSITCKAFLNKETAKKRDNSFDVFHKLALLYSYRGSFAKALKVLKVQSVYIYGFGEIGQMLYRLIKDKIKIEEIQDLIETSLKEKKYDEVYDSFANYRERRAQSRAAFTEDKRSHKFLKTLEGLALKSASEDDTKRENGNIDGNSAMGTMLQYGSTVSKEFAKAYLMKKKFADAHDNGDIHIHDMDFLPMGTTTCMQIDLNKLKYNSNQIAEYEQFFKSVYNAIKNLDLDGVYLVKESKRYYPEDTYMSHTLGYVGIDNQGLSGLELIYDKYLTGKDGAIKYFSDAKGNKLKLSEIYIFKFFNIILTISSLLIFNKVLLIDLT